MDLEKSFGLTITTESKEYTQDYIPVEDIVDGVIIVRRGRRKSYVKILEIVPINFALKSPADQNRTIRQYVEWLKTAPSNIQIKIVTQYTDTDAYLDKANAALQEEINEECKKTIEQYIEYLQTQATLQTTEKHYYLIFEYEDKGYSKAATSEEELIERINQKAKQIRNDFHSIGNDVIVMTGPNSSKRVAELLYNFYNPQTSRMEPFNYRVRRIMEDTKIVTGIKDEKNLPPADIKTLLAPKSIDTEESPDYIVIDGMYKGHFFIKSNTYPLIMSTESGWLARIINFGLGFDVDIFFNKGNTKEKLRAIKNHSKFAYNGRMNAEYENTDFDEKMNNYEGTMYMQKAMVSLNEDIYDMTVLVTISAETREIFYEMRAKMKEESSKMNLSFGECKRFQDVGLESTAPLLMLAPKLFNLSHRNLTTSGVAAGYPFTAYSLADKDGIPLGFHRRYHSMISMDIFDADKYSNSNMAIYGKTGAGKTYTLLTIITRLRCQGIQQFILSPDKQDEFRRVCDAVGGTFVNLAPSSADRINPLDIMPMDSIENRLLGGEGYTEKMWLIDKIDNLKVWFSYLVPGITKAELTKIQTILLELYADYGISEDNDSIYEDKATGKLKKMPILSDLYEKIAADKTLNPDIEVILSMFVNGVAKNMNGQTNVDLDNKFVVFGLENLKGDLLAPTLFIILEYVWGKCRENKTKKKMITIDEGWQLLNGDNIQVGKFVEHIFKVIRGYGGGAIFATQSVADLLQNEKNYGNSILSCSYSKIILEMESKDLAMINAELGLSPEEASTIIEAQRGEALLCAGSTHIPITITASEYEHMLFTTKRSDLELLVRRKSSERKRYGN